MIDRLRALANRPIGESERRGALVLAGAVILGAAVFFLLGGQSPGVPVGSPTPVVTPTRAPITTNSPVEEDEQPAGPTPLEVREAKTTARRFLRGYLPYSYGKGSAGRILGASDELLRELGDEPPHAPLNAERGGDAKVTALQAEEAEPGLISVLAFVEDSERDYALSLTLERVGRAWRVSKVAE